MKVDVSANQIAADGLPRGDATVRPKGSLSVLIPAHNDAEILETTVTAVVSGRDELGVAIRLSSYQTVGSCHSSRRADARRSTDAAGRTVGV